MRELTDSEKIARDVAKSSSDVPYLADDLEHYIFDMGFSAALDHSAAQIAALQAAWREVRDTMEFAQLRAVKLEAENRRLWAVYQEVYDLLETEGFLNMGPHPPTPYEKKVSELENKLVTLFNEKALGEESNG